jgi:hypothetical protein
MKRLIILFFLSLSVFAIAQTSQPRYELITATGTDTYAATVQQAATVLVNGFSFRVKFTNANTGASTLNVNTSGAVTLRKSDGTALSSGDITAATWYTVVYDGTASQWRLSGGSSSGGGGSSVISALTAATGTNTINNAAYKQEWQWNTLAATDALKLSSTSTLIDHTAGTNGLLSVAMSGINSTSSKTAIGFSSVVSNSGTSSTNIGVYSSATGATTNIAYDGVGLFRSSSYTLARIPFFSTAGLMIDDARLTYDPGQSLTNENTSNTSVTYASFTAKAVGSTTYWGSSSSAYTDLPFIGGSKSFVINIGGSGIVMDAYSGGNIKFGISSSQMMNIVSTGIVFGAGTITSGSVGFDFQSTTLGLLMPRVTNIASVSTPVAGMIAYDAATNKFNFHEGSNWLNIGLSVSSNATDAGFTAVINSINALPAATLTTARTITMPSVTNGARIEFHNYESVYAWNLSGVSVYLADGTTVVTSLLYNVPTFIEGINGKWIITN